MLELKDLSSHGRIARDCLGSQWPVLLSDASVSRLLGHMAFLVAKQISDKHKLQRPTEFRHAREREKPASTAPFAMRHGWMQSGSCDFASPHHLADGFAKLDAMRLETVTAQYHKRAKSLAFKKGALHSEVAFLLDHVVSVSWDTYRSETKLNNSAHIRFTVPLAYRGGDISAALSSSLDHGALSFATCLPVLGCAAAPRPHSRAIHRKYSAGC